MTETTINERLASIAKNYGLSIRAFEKEIGVSNGFVKNASKGIGADKMQSILRIFPSVNEQWLLTGEGEMLKKEEKEEKEEVQTLPYREVSRKTKGAIPFFDDYMLAACGPSGFPDSLDLRYAKYIIVPDLPRCDFAIRTTGRSMINHQNPELSIPDGSIACCRYWHSTSYIRYGAIYAISTFDGIIIKKIMPSDDPDVLNCISYNSEEFPPFPLPKNEIYDNGLAEVIAVIAVKSV